MRRGLRLRSSLRRWPRGRRLRRRGILKFEVAIIKPTKPGTPGGDGIRSTAGGKRYVGSSMPLRNYLEGAYQLKPDQITGGPGWVYTEPYDMNAEAEKPSSFDELHIMLQNLLTEQFKLRFHFETKEMPAYALTIGKGGPKNLKDHPGANGGDFVLGQATEGLVHDKWSAHCASMNFLSFRMSLILDLPVVNQTNLDGCYDFQLTFTRELPRGVKEGQLFNGTPIDASGPTVFQALQSQLGLKLEEKKAPAETLVIEHAERPTEE